MTRIDGAASINVWLPHHAGYIAPVETIENVNISTNSFDAAQGMTGGAATAVQTKSGTNTLQGLGVLLPATRTSSTPAAGISTRARLDSSIVDHGRHGSAVPSAGTSCSTSEAWERNDERNGLFDQLHGADREDAERRLQRSARG